MTDTVTKDNARQRGAVFGRFRKTALTVISEFTVPPGTAFETPEGLKAEDEECRIAFDSQGGVYPIRESVFRETYEYAEPEPSDLQKRLDAQAAQRAADAKEIGV